MIISIFQNKKGEIVMFSLNNLQISQVDQLFYFPIIALNGQDNSKEKYLFLKFIEELERDPIVPRVIQSKVGIFRTEENHFYLEECNKDNVKSSEEFNDLLNRNVIVLARKGISLLVLNDFNYKINGSSRFTFFCGIGTKRKHKEYFPSRGKLDKHQSEKIKKNLASYAYLFDKNSTTSTNGIYRLPLKPINSNPSPLIARVTTTSAKISLPLAPSIPLHETFFDSIEKFNGNNSDKDTSMHHYRLLKQAMYFVKEQGCTEITLSNSFDYGEKIETSPYFNESGQLTNTMVKYNYYILGKNKEGKELKLIIERVIYPRLHDSLLALKEAAAYAQRQQETSLV